MAGVGTKTRHRFVRNKKAKVGEVKRVRVETVLRQGLDHKEGNYWDSNKARVVTVLQH